MAFTNELSARVINVPVRLDFSVDASGNVGLDASTTSSDAFAITTVAGWDGPVGSLTNPVVFNTAFSLTVSASKQTGAASVNLSEADAGGLAVAGQNSSRIDGGNLVPPNVETLRISSSAAYDVQFKRLDWNNSQNGVTMVAAAPGGAAATRLITSASGTWSLAGAGTDFIAASGESLELSTDSANGYALAGFSFDLIVPELPPNRTNDLPNVVVIIADDLGYSDISYNPHHGPEVSTPNIDKLIRNGVWFSNAYTSGNICAPSRAGFAAGVYQHRLGVHNETDVNSAGFPSDFPLFPQHLKQPLDGIEDYVCKMVGKWHQNRDRTATVGVDGNGDGDFIDFVEDYGFAVPETMRYHPMRRGYDEVYGFIDLGGSSYWNYGNGFFEDYYRHQSGSPIGGVNDGDALETYMTTRYTEEACAFIEAQSASNKPFFLHLAYNAVHTPMEAPASPAGLSEGDPGWFPDATWYSNHFPNMWQTPAYNLPGALDTQAERDAIQATRASLMAMLYHLDRGIGQVVETLKARGVWENTIVVFWSDNGGALASAAANAPLRERKHFNYEGGVRVPMALSWPAGLGAYSNSTVSAPVISLDILPTVLDAAVIEPVGGFDVFDGKSLLPLIRGETDSIHDALYWSEGGETGEYAIRQGDWKLYIAKTKYELYNLAADIGESNDLAGIYPDKVRALRQAFFAWMSEMTEVSGDNLDDRLWSTVAAPVPGASAIDLYRVRTTNGLLQVEYDEKAGWLPTGPVFESTDSLTNNHWVPVAPDELDQLDRYLELGTYRAGFAVDRPQRFIRIKGMAP